MCKDDAYSTLAFAVLELAVKDYKKALRAYKRNPCPSLADVCDRYERLFVSEWFCELAQDKVDGLDVVCVLRDKMGV